jgi:hypothetical protein
MSSAAVSRPFVGRGREMGQLAEAAGEALAVLASPAAHHFAARAISSAFWGHQLPAAGPWLQRPSDSPGGLSQ